MIFAMLRWWYITGWKQAAERIRSWPLNVEQMFSLAILLQTLFSPWRRIMTVANRGLDAKLRAALDNLVSRCIGFIIRLFAILIATVGMIFAFILGLGMALAWPLLPLAFVGFIIKGISG